MSDWARVLDEYHRAMQRLYWCRSGCNRYHSPDETTYSHFAMVVRPEPTGSERARMKEAAVVLATSEEPAPPPGPALRGSLRRQSAASTVRGG